MSNLINWLEGKINSCEEFGGMEREKWAFIQTLKKVRKEAIIVTPCCTEFKCGQQRVYGEVKCLKQCSDCKLDYSNDI